MGFPVIGSLYHKIANIQLISLRLMYVVVVCIYCASFIVKKVFEVLANMRRQLNVHLEVDIL